jgi:hypothetical protein
MVSPDRDNSLQRHKQNQATRNSRASHVSFAINTPGFWGIGQCGGLFVPYENRKPLAEYQGKPKRQPPNGYFLP